MELSMISSGPDQDPPVRFNRSDHFANFHPASGSASARRRFS